MPKLYLVGVTEDRSGLVLAKSPRAKKGESVLEVSHEVLDAIAEIRRYRSEGTTVPSVKSAALPSRRVTAGEVSTPSSLSPREIQSRLRRGESIQSVARRAGVEEWRIEVYAAPIAAEQARVVARARELTMTKRGAGPSGRPLGESVQANIVEKRVSMNADEFEAGWIAYEPEPDRWVVRFEYVSRGRRQGAEWIYEEAAGTIMVANRMATVLGWRDPRRTGRLPPLPEAPRTPTAAPAKRATARKPAARKAAPRKPAAARRAPAKKRAPSRKAAVTRKRAPAPKRTTARKPAASRKPPAKSTRRAATAKKATRKTTAKKAPSGPEARAAEFPNLRIVEPPPEIEDADAGDWRRRLDRRREGDAAAPYARRSWRDEVEASRAGDDTSLELPSWLQDTGTARPEPKPKAKPEAKPEAEVPARPEPVRGPRPGVSVDATRVTGRRRSLRKRDRPLRAR